MTRCRLRHMPVEAVLCITIDGLGTHERAFYAADRATTAGGGRIHKRWNGPDGGPYGGAPSPLGWLGVAQRRLRDAFLPAGTATSTAPCESRRRPVPAKG